MPTALKIIRNQTKKRKVKISTTEPKPVGDLADAPEHLDGDAREIWNYAIEHAPRGLLKKIDSGVLEIWCKAHALHRAAVAEVRKTGMLIKSPTQGVPIQSPYLPIINKQALIMLRACDHMGFSPASRTRIMMGDAPAASGGWGDIENAG